MRRMGLSDLSNITRLAGSLRPGMGLECGNWNQANYAVFVSMPIINSVILDSLISKMRVLG